MSSIRTDKKRTVEILAPAGSFECMKAAYHAGADAVYAGGAMFGARASAVNFAGEELTEAINYAHIYGKKFYLTVNTLLKEEELEEQLYDYLLPAYRAGLDAVIVQDLGVLLYIRRYFPDLPIHASTQMNTTGPYFAKELQRLGVSRIVTARELSLEEISEIYQATGLEIESFVHGALCYSYSGQCLLSSMIGGRSGNRGRCAQPCRLAYETSGTKKYLFSPKDLCTLKLIPDILEAGVYSLKIEGRMKKPEYVASVTELYRKYVDLYMEKGREGFRVEEKDINMLKEIYNRGGFTDGYYKRHNGREMMSLEKPNHCGVKVAELQTIKKDMLFLKALSPLSRGDVLEFDVRAGSFDYTVGEPLPQGKLFAIKNKFQNGAVIAQTALKSDAVFRMRNNALIEKITETHLNAELKRAVTGTAEFKKNQPAVLTLSCAEISVQASGNTVQPAKSRPLEEADIREKLEKTGGTEFFFEKLDIFCEEDLFVPVRELNELRRRAFSSLRQAMLDAYRREEPESRKKQEEKEEVPFQNRIPKVSVLVSTKEQFSCVLHHTATDRIYLETALFSYEALDEMLQEAEKYQKKIFCALPYIFRKEAREDFLRHLSFYTDTRISGFVFRNLESYFSLLSLKNEKLNKDFIFDAQIYCYNKETYYYLKSLGAAYIGLSREMNVRELKELGIADGEMDIYGAVPVMLTAGCIKKTLGKCDGISSVKVCALKDRTGAKLPVASVCRHCYNVIYHSAPLGLFDEMADIRLLSPGSLRISFTSEEGDRCREILARLSGTAAQTGQEKKYTKGHFRRGVL